jgi:MFS family permease
MALLPRSVRVLRHRDFAFVQLGNAVSNLGTWMQYVGIGWALSGLTRWPLALGMSFVAQFGPSFVLGPVAGAAADRFDRRRIVIISTVASALPAAAIGLLITRGELTIGRLLFLATLGGIAQAFTQPAATAIVPRLVPAEEIHEAVTFTSAAVNLARVAGPSIGGAAIRLWGLDWAFYLNAISFLGVIVAWAFVRPSGTRVSAAERAEPYLQRLRAGVAYASREPLVRDLLLLNAVIAAFLFHAPLMPDFARVVLHGDEFTFSLLTTATGVGAVVGAFLAGEIHSDAMRRRVTAIAAVVSPIALLVFASSRRVGLSVACLVVFGLGYFLFLATSQSLIILVTPDDYRGRVMGLFGMASIGAVPIAGLAGGAVASWLGTPQAVTVAAAITLVFTAWQAADVLRRPARRAIV